MAMMPIYLLFTGYATHAKSVQSQQRSALFTRGKEVGLKAYWTLMTSDTEICPYRSQEEGAPYNVKACSGETWASH